jgi:tRNA(Ile)-lysidine synthase
MDRPGDGDRPGRLSGAGTLADTLLARCAFPPAGRAVSCGVSGGADSLALLVLACRAGCAVTAVHVDHGFRPTGADEAARVAAAAARFGARFEAVVVSVPDGPNLEARARRARLDALPPDVLLGHTADDRAETVLLNLLRGSGATGLAALGPSPRRPLLGLRRHETEALCRSYGLEAFHDPSNSDPRFRRNRVRHELLPLLDDIAGRDTVPLLTRLGDLVGQLDRHVTAEAALLDPTDVAALRDAPQPVAAAAVRAWLRQGNGPERYPPDAATVERVLDVVRGARRATEVGGGRRVRRSAGRLVLESGEKPAIPARRHRPDGLP